MFFGHAGHVLDIVYAFQNYRDLLPAASPGVSQRMGLYLINLANGLKDKPLFDPVTGTRLITVMDEQHRYCTTTQQSYDEMSRNGAGTLLQTLGITRLTKALDLFQYGIL